MGAASAQGCCVTSQTLQGAAPILAAESLSFERTSLAPDTSVLTKPGWALEEQDAWCPYRFQVQSSRRCSRAHFLQAAVADNVWVNFMEL